MSKDLFCVMTSFTLSRYPVVGLLDQDRKSTRLNSSHLVISYAVFCLKKKMCHLFHWLDSYRSKSERRRLLSRQRLPLATASAIQSLPNHNRHRIRRRLAEPPSRHSVP